MVMVLAVLIVLLHCIAIPTTSALAEGNQCEYYYSEQPPRPLSCDPYETRELKMECTAHGPVGAEFEVSWFSSRSDITPSSLLGLWDGAVLLRNRENNSSIRSQMREDETGKTIRSRLQIQLLRDGSAARSAAFWCSVTQSAAADGSSGVTLVPSMVFILHAAETYETLPSCGDTPQSFHGEKCAAISVLQPATPLAMPPTPTVQSVHSTVIDTPPSTSSAWQELSPSSQLLRPTMSVLSDPPPLEEGGTNMHTIVIPILACIAGAFGMLCLTSCVYIQCYYRRKTDKTVRKKVVEATHHTYSVPNSISSCQWKGAHQRPRLAILPHSPSSSPTLPPSHRTRSLKLGDSQNISLWSDQYVEMAAGVDCQRGQQREASYSSWPTLNRNGRPSSFCDSEEWRQGLSYEVPLPSRLEPDYTTISSLCVSYLIPVASDVEPRPHKNSQIHRPRALNSDDTTAPTDHCLHPPSLSPASPHSHDYEEIIHITANRAYLETAVSTEQEQTAAGSPALPPSPTKTQCTNIGQLEAQGTVLET